MRLLRWPRWLTPYRLGYIAVIVISTLLDGSWLRSADELAWAVVLTVLWFVAKDLWREWAHPEIRAARLAAQQPPPAGAPRLVRIWYWLTVATAAPPELEEGGGLEPPRDCSPTP